MRLGTLTLCCAAYSVVACSPLAQAPLVYSSKVAVGLDISATGTESPGASAVIGYKQVDAAYVPVMVARPCTDSDSSGAPRAGTPGSGCAASAYRLERLEATHMTKREDPTPAQLQAKQLLDRYDKALTTRESKLLESNTLKAEIASTEELLRKQNEQIDQVQAIDAAKRTPEQQTTLDTKDSLLKPLQSKKQAAEAKLVTVEADRAEADRLIRMFDPLEIERARVVSSGDTKKDAYSVFGSFDANTTTGASISAQGDGKVAPKVDAGLVIGKVFSTGVASQNLTAGLKDYYSGMGRLKEKSIDCILAALTDEALKRDEAQRKDVLATCKVLASPP